VLKDQNLSFLGLCTKTNQGSYFKAPIRLTLLLLSICSASLQSYAHDDISVGSWMMGLNATYVDDDRLCCLSAVQEKVCSFG
uniref:Uncharacterized protein n=1 Tax=Aegilops tauschii subsp. strangulata TaxID=200361 RepID=A0A453QWI1_AEGTS